MDITSDILKKIAPTAKKSIIDDLAVHLAPTLEKYGINTPLRVKNFLAQAAHESAGFKTLKEYWGPTSAQKNYEGRKDLGNVNPGDGKKYMGRGIFQLTGRANYEKFGKLLKVDFVNNPDLAAEAKYSMLTACEYWNSRKINIPADKDDITSVTKLINGGTNGLSDRIAYAKRIAPLLGEIFSLPSRPLPTTGQTTPVKPDIPTRQIIMKKGDKNDGVKILQIALNSKLNSNLIIDGDFGKATEKAVMDYQKSIKETPADGQITPDLYKKILTI